MLEVIEHARAKRKFAALDAWCVTGPDSPRRFYLSLGFKSTGKTDRNEVLLSLPLAPTAP